MNVLFICSRNHWRSPTAEHVFRRYPGLNARSAGTQRQARKTISPAILSWADVICVMEEQHKSRLLADYSRLLQHKPVHVLDIPDRYAFMDPELVALLEDIVPQRLGLRTPA
ncbi:low molecular weight protein tyrosine phosphatase family protein [Vagococcus sp. WN89Y]|uniref:low molecular weight protein tyrosine phosphatase family protein n=1 Tax=Vagococcus sp. WN89Y TaxID=3457258 RepID=UPI003FCEE0CB